MKQSNIEVQIYTITREKNYRQDSNFDYSAV